MKTKLHFVCSITLFLFFFSNYSQEEYWNQENFKEGTQGISLKNLDNSSFTIFKVNIDHFKQQLIGAPQRGNFTGRSNTVISFPNEKGILERFRVIETPVLSEELSLKHPEIKTYLGFGIDTPGARARFSVTPLGVKTMVTYADRLAVFSNPISPEARDINFFYTRKANLGPSKIFNCSTEEDNILTNRYASSARDANDQTLRTFRIAISTSAEYTNSVEGGGSAATALAAVTATLNRTNEVFEVDMAVTFSLISGTNILFENTATDPYPANGGLNTQLQTELDTTIGDANYDIGHVFDFEANNGNAGCIGCVCVTGSKGSGWSAHNFTDNDGGPYMSDFFDIDYVPHEIGHQMGANHTWSFNSEGTGVNYEPGSGTTIMGYAGITGSDDVQDHSDPNFHYASIDQILNNLTTQTCWTSTAIVNNPPVANAGPDYSIPPGTAFILKGTATDLDGGDILTYAWEQIDDGITTTGNFGPTKTTGALWRARPPSTSGDRYMPILSRVLAGQLTETAPVETVDNSSWETVSTVARDLNFALTVRDRSEAGGTGQSPQSDFDTMTVSVEGGTAFTVNDPQVWAPNSTPTLIWNVGDTNIAPINCLNVNIKLSTDGGLTFPIDLALNTPNDGSEVVSIPNLPNTTTARVLVESADNIFYAISNPDFSIDDSPDFTMTNSSGIQAPDCGVDTADYTINYSTLNGFSENTVFTASNLPAGSGVNITPNNLSSDGSFNVQLTGLSGVATGNYTFTVTGTATSITKNINVDVIVTNDVCPSVANTIFETSTTLVVFNTINNPSAKPSGYSDYTSISTDVNIGSSYDLTVNANTDGSFRTQTKVWVDWNQDCDFDDAEEEYDLGEAINVADGPTANSPLSVSVPSFAVLGNTIMRISTRYTPPTPISFPTSCENGADAEVEDYTINVLMSLSVNEQELSNFVIYPNPNKGNFTIKFNTPESNEVSVKIFDTRGRKLIDNLINNSGNFNETINLKNVQAGMYFVNVSDGERRSTKKIIIE